VIPALGLHPGKVGAGRTADRDLAAIAEFGHLPRAAIGTTQEEGHEGASLSKRWRPEQKGDSPPQTRRLSPFCSGLLGQRQHSGTELPVKRHSKKLPVTCRLARVPSLPWRSDGRGNRSCGATASLHDVP